MGIMENNIELHRNYYMARFAAQKDLARELDQVRHYAQQTCAFARFLCFVEGTVEVQSPERWHSPEPEREVIYNVAAS